MGHSICFRHDVAVFFVGRFAGTVLVRDGGWQRMSVQAHHHSSPQRLSAFFSASNFCDILAHLILYPQNNGWENFLSENMQITSHRRRRTGDRHG